MNAFAPTTPVTEDDIHRLVHRFYEMIQEDHEVGPIFD
jgi:truncated hemoglobin YjbI